VRLAGLALLALFLTPAALASEDDEPTPVRRELAHLRLGDYLDQIQKVYVPAREWPSQGEVKGRIKRMRVDRAAVKDPEPNVDTMYLGLRKERLVEIQLVYSAGYTRNKSVEELAGNLALIYGKPRHSQGKFWWTDEKTVLRAFYAEVPVERKDGTTAVEFRTSLQVMEAGLFERAAD
jgi:hypothetical protein